MINYFLGAVIMTVPFFMKSAPITALNLSQEWIFAVLAMLGSVVVGIRKPHANIVVLATSLGVVAFFAKDPFGTFQYYQLAMCFAGVAFLAVVNSEKKNINLELLGKLFSAVCLIESFWVLLNVVGIELFQEWMALISKTVTARNHDNVVIGSLGHINHSGALIACTLPFLHFLFWPIPFVALALCKSSFPVICAGVSLIAFYSYKTVSFKALYAGAIALFMSGLALILGLIPADSYFTDHNRIRAWTKLFHDLGFQVLGKGLGHIPSVFSKKDMGWEHFYQMHNEWVELYAISGLLGVVVGLYLIAPAFKNKGNPAINACLISLLVNSLGNFTFHMAPLFMVFGTCYALQLGKE